MTTGKRIVTERAAMARLRRVLAKEGGKVGHHRITGYYLFSNGIYTERGSYTDFLKWCQKWEVLQPFEEIEA